ncbi:serine hydrolase domain-containing protein [Kineobactrum salinum]|uniref:Beta-lactamase family protein n=1 Tax=Kineobactrum salinum TaxID=2708301 RepID=A0A6C0U3Y8_9GAMM|nr:serine hydrolase domain-containing protein [Kineobactrum salinum]QIB65085.1 beta-lactamase family protein [Kineobactrum salinum]
MMTLKSRFGSALLALMLILGTQAARAGIDDPAEVEAVVDGIVIPLMRNFGSPSGTVVIAHKGELILAKGYGFEDIEQQIPVDPYRTLFRPGSASKLFTWVAVMQLVEQGRLDLDADVNTYLETFSIEDSFPEPVTLRHILTHTAGFEEAALSYLIGNDPDKVLPLAESMARFQPARVTPPGAQTAYSNYATALAGLIVANVSGMPFNDYIRRHILEPLAMQNSSFEEPLPAGLDARMAGSYGLEAGDFVRKPFEIVANFGPAGALSATATDMVRFGEAVRNGGELDGGRILQPETMALTLAPQFSHDERMMGMALGFYANDYNGHRVVGHGGDTNWFHSYLGVDEANELTMFFSFGADGGSIVRTLLAPGFYDHFFPRDEARPVPPADFSERAARFAGNYAPWRASFTGFEKALGMAFSFTVAPSENNTLIVTMGDKAKQYAEIDENLFREVSSKVSLDAGFSPRLLAFQQDEHGAINGFVLDGLPFMSMRKLPVWATPAFNGMLVLLSMLVFAAVLLRRFYQRREIRSWPAPERTALRAAVLASVCHVVTLLLGAVVMTAVGDSLFDGVPTLFKLWLWLPIIATLAGFYLLYSTVTVWRRGSFASVWARLRYTAVVIAALALSWFYYYWNLLGFNYY